MSEINIIFDPDCPPDKIYLAPDISRLHGIEYAMQDVENQLRERVRAGVKEFLDHKNWYMFGDPYEPIALPVGTPTGNLVIDEQDPFETRQTRITRR